MQQLLEDFYKVVRAAGITVAPSDSIETSRAVALVGYSNREVLKHSFQLSLAKSAPEQTLVAECFDTFFRFDSFQDEPASAAGAGAEASTEKAADAQRGPDADHAGYRGELPLARMLVNRDTAALAAAMSRSARAVGLTNIWFFTQKSLYTQQIMQAMGLRDLHQEIAALGRDDCPTAIAQAGKLRAAKDYLYEQVRDFVEKQLSMYGKNAARTLREDHLQRAKLSNIEQRDFHLMHDLVRRMAKRLSSLYAKKKKAESRGVLDFRRTLRRNVAYDGVLFETYWKAKFIDKPRLLVLCDISGSVQAYSRFLLLFLYSLKDVVQRMDSYVFTGNLIPVNAIFDQYPVAEAIDKIMTDHGMGGSNYGTALLDLEDQCLDGIDNKTTVLILGDARNNNLPPRTEVLQQVYQRAKRVIWLNPEPEGFWHTGDSVMTRYRPYCHLAKTCNTLDGLERVLDDLLKAATRSA